MLRARKLKRLLRSRYGKAPDYHYFSGDMDSIRAYYDFRLSSGREAESLDDITWNDLDMDRVFQRINPRRCSSGEQVLYAQLRTPALEREDYERRLAWIRFAEADEERRLKLEMILARLGCTRRADLCTAFYPSRHGVGMLLVYLALFLFLLFSVVSIALPFGPGVKGIAVSIVVNLLVHEFGRRSTQTDYDTVNYSVNMIFAMQRLRKLRDPELDRLLAEAYGSLDRLRAVLRTGGVSTVMDNDGLGDLFTSVTLLDLIAYEFVKNKLGRCHEDMLVIHEALGRLDAGIAVASYRKSLPRYAEPVLDFSRETVPYMNARDLVHPLLENAVPNDLVTDRPVLITGSNASGKSTYLKTAALAAVMAQSIGTVLAESYDASAFRLYSSMALRDDLFHGESYYIVETRSLKRILDAAETGEPVFCVIDEVLRGTNTVERIAASSEILSVLADKGVLCLAATHDVELCELLADTYRQFHFTEQVGEDEMLFDYKLREGKAVTRNAIHLLRLMGFEASIVENADRRAESYLESGIWKRS